MLCMCYILNTYVNCIIIYKEIHYFQNLVKLHYFTIHLINFFKYYNPIK